MNILSTILSIFVKFLRHFKLWEVIQNIRILNLSKQNKTSYISTFLIHLLKRYIYVRDYDHITFHI